jgi:hypothetical protein
MSTANQNFTWKNCTIYGAQWDKNTTNGNGCYLVAFIAECGTLHIIPTAGNVCDYFNPKKTNYRADIEIRIIRNKRVIVGINY